MVCDEPRPVKLEDLTLLIGRAEIARYCKVNPHTITRWIRRWAFPAGYLPDKRLASSVFLIDQWLSTRGRQYEENRYGKDQS